MPDGLLFCLNLNLSMCIRVRSRSPATFKTKLYVTKANNSVQPLTTFYHKQLHLRSCIGLELDNSVTCSLKVVKSIEGTLP